LESAWDKIEFKSDVKKTQIRKVGRFKVQFNQTRNSQTTNLSSIGQNIQAVTPFDPQAINFNKIFSRDPGSILFEVTLDGKPVTVAVGNEPALRYHFLFIPRRNENQPQMIEAEDIRLVYEMFDKIGVDALRLGENFYCPGAGINQLHLHGLYARWPIESASRDVVGEQEGVIISEIRDFPAKGFVFVSEDKAKMIKVAMHFIRNSREINIPINLIFTPKEIYLLPRSKLIPREMGMPFGFMEMAGEIVASTEGIYENATEEQINAAISDVSVENVDELREMSSRDGGNGISEEHRKIHAVIDAAFRGRLDGNQAVDIS